MQKPIRVLIVDDHLDFLRSANHFLSLQPSLKVVGSVTSGEEALEQIQRLAPNLVLIDWAMPELSGLETTRRIKACKDAPQVVILTLHDIPQYRKAAQSAGADGFLSKKDWSEQLMPFIQRLFDPSNGCQNLIYDRSIKHN
jgi:DNA-binding NarL/FixJ family response regulator